MVDAADTSWIDGGYGEKLVAFCNKLGLVYWSNQKHDDDSPSLLGKLPGSLVVY